eukprot:CAMPEP_0117650336 /NCGR_PEP_ID=MMETSP0804-20121206/1485_1 /TAXON_ID=1074897 /ORGANISM="Tetraselmis astigmatica, Strain CCMP880" /LENGTH=819 /DNA_ID=CAMNT_0005456201 /DNA_START=188 /DNA_END=2647 /DNA_ORIENTATION=+
MDAAPSVQPNEDFQESPAQESLAGNVENLEDALDSFQWPSQALKGRLWRVNSEQWSKIMEVASVPLDTVQALQRQSVFQPDGRNVFNPQVLRPKPGKRHRSVCGCPVMGPTCKFALMWRTFLLYFDLSYTAFFVPISVGFRLGAAADDTTKWIDVAAGIIFMMALVLGFHIGVIAQNNLRQTVVKDGRLVARYYMHRGPFVIDLISSLVYLVQLGAIIYLETAEAPDSRAYWVLDSVQLLRMVRLVHVFSVVQKLLVASTVSRFRVFRKLPSYFTTVLLVAYMLYWIVNFFACLWFWVGSWYTIANQPNWIAADVESSCNYVSFAWQGSQMTDGSLPLECEDVVTVGFWGSYLVSIYWSVTTMTTVGYGDITPNNAGEIIVALLSMIGGIMMFAVLIGTMQDIISSNSVEAQRAFVLRGKLSEVDEWIDATNLPKCISHQIRKYYYESWIGQKKSDTYRNVFLDLPEQLQGIVATHLTTGILKKTRILKDIDERALSFLASKLNPVMLSMGHNVCTQGDVADRLWILQSGVMVATYGDTSVEVEAAPALIGETTILQDDYPLFEHRPCGFCATTPCQLWELRRRDLQVVVRLYPHVGEVLHRGVSQHLLQRAGIISLWGEVDTDGIQTFLADIKQTDQSTLTGLAEEEGGEGVKPVEEEPDSGGVNSAKQPAPSGEQDKRSLNEAVSPKADSRGIRGSPPPSDLASSQVPEFKLEGVGDVDPSAIINLAMGYNEELRKELQPVQEVERDSPEGAVEVEAEAPEAMKLMKEILSRIKTLELSIQELQPQRAGGTMASLGTLPNSSSRKWAATPQSGSGAA